jgi:hypothetical protein
MFSPLCDRGNEPQKNQDIERDCTPLHWVHTILFLSVIGDLLLSSIIGIQTMVKIESSVKQAGQNLSGPVFKICFIASMSTDNTTCILEGQAQKAAGRQGNF